jgi:aspartate aminotransferase-like enzyme
MFKIATEESEFEQIHRLNYKTFVEEIPQHPQNADKKLVDRFHQDNTYIICLKNNRLVGTVAIRGERPFSLDQKLANLDFYLPPRRSLCEIRLLAVERDQRCGSVFHGLMKALYAHCRRQGYDLALISGTVQQRKLYEHFGFIPFGPLVGTEDASFQPMYLTLESFEARPINAITQRWEPSRERPYVNLLPGPVRINPHVRQRFNELPVSHRSESFIADFHATKQLLCDLVGSQNVEILMGSGTLANDVVAAQLSIMSGTGLILSNGEFGNRLLDHASRFGLSCEVLEADWGDIFHASDIRQTIRRYPKIRWFWAVHCETSTGILNDMTMLKGICADANIKLCLDCISSIGAVPVDLRGVFLASAVSGKGLGAYPGLSMVFYNHQISPAPTLLPRYLDLGFYAAQRGIPFTLSSNLLYALQTSLKNRDSESGFEHTAKLSSWLRSQLRGLGFTIVAPDAHASPAVTTIALPRTLSSKEVGRRLEDADYFLSYMSSYLLERNWIQICLMGEYSQGTLIPLVNEFRILCQQYESRRPA